MRRFNRDPFVNSTELPLLYKDTLSKHFVIRSQDSTERSCSSNDILRILYLSKRSAPIENQDWTNISAYHYTKAVVDLLSDEEQNVLKDMYRTIYPELQNASVPSSYRRCSVVSLSGEVFGSEKSNNKRSSYVMAYWNKPGGNILNEVGEGELTPGIIEKFIVHNLIVGDENNINLLAKIRWMIPDANRLRHYCGEPVEVWSSNMHETNGPSAYMPVQRIFCRYVRANGNISGKPVAFVCPLNRGMNV
ncbi:unnamed protein product [Mytilus coruscus]|uniref:Uncharacterized protein n=1 Tax=Mytilus coruscus TaxID=42192 RepID=A0A6J8BH83_MYTCO|nr:unnamed protein product [Mytilus coruscus]